jgi:hypothetical protein
MDDRFSLPPVRDPSAKPAARSTAWQWWLIAGGAFVVTLVVVPIGVTIATAPPDQVVPRLAVGGFVLFMIASTFLPIVGVVALVFFLQRHVHQHRLAQWTEFAQRVGGEVVVRPVPIFGYAAPQAVLFAHGKTPCVLDIETVGSGKHQRHFTRLTYDLGRPTQFYCQLAPQYALSFVRQWFGGQDAQLGWPEFDERYIVKTNDELRAPEILDRTVQQSLLDLRKLAGQYILLAHEGGFAELTVYSGRLQIRTLGQPKNTEQLLAHAGACGRLADLLGPRV